MPGQGRGRLSLQGQGRHHQEGWRRQRTGGRLRVQFFEFGNTEVVDRVLEYPRCLGLELAPCAVEVVPVQTLPKGGERQGVLEACLMGEDMLLELLVEKDRETGMKVVRFYENKEEVVFDRETEVVVEEDVVIESERDVKLAAEQEEGVKTGEEPGHLLVPGLPLPQSGSVKVVLVLVNSVDVVWVTRVEEEPKVEKMMAALQKRAPQLEDVKAPKVGCVYGARFSEDDVMYRVMVVMVGSSAAVRFVDYGNCEAKEVSQLVHLPGKMALYPAAALRVELKDNKDVEDSLEHREVVRRSWRGR